MKRLNILKKIAKEAGEIVRKGYHRHKDISHKGVVDLVTNYDIATEKFIIEALKEDFDEYTIVGEESYESRGYHYPKAIYIDPIDGTTNFIHGIPHLAISIGLWEDEVPIIGVVYNPILDELYYAYRGEGAYCNGRAIEVSTQNSLQQSLIGTGFPYAKVNRGVEYKWVIASLTSILPYIRDIRRLGAAALDLCYLAEGKIDAFYEIDLKPWDTAGAIVILLEAGGRVTTLDSKSFDFDDKVIVATNRRVHSELMGYLEEI
jgi:myo-inositol-1(or 4)-monophosphatase